MTGFQEVRFPDNIAYGATGGPEFATTIVVTGAGHEQRNVNWAEARGRWDVASGLKNQQQLDELIAFFRGAVQRQPQVAPLLRKRQGPDLGPGSSHGQPPELDNAHPCPSVAVALTRRNRAQDSPGKTHCILCCS
jgi:Conserved hypothetical protein 2217 (DUF2460)